MLSSVENTNLALASYLLAFNGVGGAARQRGGAGNLCAVRLCHVKSFRQRVGRFHRVLGVQADAVLVVAGHAGFHPEFNIFQAGSIICFGRRCRDADQRSSGFPDTKARIFTVISGYCVWEKGLSLTVNHGHWFESNLGGPGKGPVAK